MNINEIVKAAMIAPKAAAPAGDNAPATQEVVRVASLWAQSRQRELNYTGPSSAGVAAEIAKLDEALNAKKVEAFQAAAELDRQTGGAFLNTSATAARVSLPFDTALLARYKAANEEAGRLSARRADAQRHLTTARQYEQAQADLVSILAALIGGAA